MTLYENLLEQTLKLKNKNLYCLLKYIKNYKKIKQNNNRLISEFYINWLIDEENKVIFYNNPKAACTSLMISMFKCTDIKVDDNYLVQKHMYFSEHNIKELPKDLDKYFKFGFVRNPFAKLVSFYKNRYDNNVLKNHKMESNIPNYLTKVDSFEDLTYKILKMPDFMLEPHFFQQYRIFYKNSKCMVDFIGKVENIQQDYKNIQEKYGYLPIQISNETSKSKKWEDYYTIKAANNVYKKYRKDFEIFGYQESYDKLIEYIKNKN